MTKHNRSIETNTGADALALVKLENPDVFVSDLRMSGMGGHQLQLELKRIAPNLPVIIITAFGSIQTAVESMKLGAFDYLTKPFSNDELLLVVARALENRQLRQEVRRLRGELAHSYGLPSIIAANPRMVAVLQMLQQITDSELQNAIQRAIILCRDNTLTTKDLPPKVAGYDMSPRRAIEEAVDRRLSLDLLEREYVRAVLESVNGNKREAAAILQIDRKTLYRKLEEPEPAEQSPPSNKAD